MTETSDRISMPAPDGPNTLMQALQLLNDARIELMDIALRRPSLDEVFLALTGDDTGGRRKDADKRMTADAYA
jgi:ABC-2 type transport system ATP-binding protein